MELGKDRVDDPVLSLYKKSLKNPPILCNYGQAEPLGWETAAVPWWPMCRKGNSAF